jgi:hypothetical protein
MQRKSYLLASNLLRSAVVGTGLPVVGALETQVSKIERQLLRDNFKHTLRLAAAGQEIRT